MQKSFLFLLILLYSLSSFSQWNAGSAINTPVVNAPKSQQNIHMVTDAKQGAVISWDDNRNSLTSSTDIYAQHLNAGGYAKWAANGVVVCADSAMQRSSTITDAGNGSVIIAWEDNRSGNFDIYAQKLDSMGNALWTAGGVVVCNKALAQVNPKIVNDNAGGAIIVWEDSLNFYWDVYAQRISSTGTALWTGNGVAVCTAANLQINPKVDMDGLGGCIITWQDKRNNSDYDIYAQAFNATGTAQWASNGVVVCNAINTQSNPRIEPDGANGAVVVWVDKRNGADYDIYAQRIDKTGKVGWKSNGLVVCSNAANQSAVDMKYMGAWGLAIAWKDFRGGTFEIYAQLLNLSGVPLLASNGIKLSAGLQSINPNVVADGTGGAIVVWQDSSSAGWDIKTQKMNSLGALQWTSGGLAVSTASDDQINPANASDGNGGAIFAWEDHRNTTDYDIYAQRLDYTGNVPAGLHEIINADDLKVICYPNPVTSLSGIQLSNNKNHQNWNISIYNSLGETIKNAMVKSEGVYEINVNEFGSGVYFYFIYLADRSASAKGTLIFSK